MAQIDVRSVMAGRAGSMLLASTDQAKRRDVDSHAHRLLEAVQSAVTCR